jgi:hypothetical protein
VIVVGGRRMFRWQMTLAWLLTVGPLLAQSPPYKARITVDGVRVHSGPGEQMPETGMLDRGSEVEVDHEEPGGWLAIQPPRGQVSWIKHVHLGPVPDQSQDTLPRNMRVHAEPVAELAAGRPGLAKPLDVRRTRVPDGTIVMVIGPKVEHAGSYWYPIEPPFNDFRYLRRESVEAHGRLPSVSVRSPQQQPQGLPAVTQLDRDKSTLPGGATPAAMQQPMATPWPNHPDWLQAEAAERDGDFHRAEQLYLRLAAEMNQPGGDPNLANLCYTRVHAAREKARNWSRPKKTTELSSAAGTMAVSDSSRWSASGTLRAAGFRIDNQATFALVAGDGRVLAYAIAGPGVDLDRFRGYNVSLFGRFSTRPELRGIDLITATQVRYSR